MTSLLLCLLLAFPAADALVGLRRAVRPAVASRAPLQSMEASSMLTSILQRVAPSQAQGEFYFFFFAGSGE
jgi:hypothetical protein